MDATFGLSGLARLYAVMAELKDYGLTDAR